MRRSLHEGRCITAGKHSLKSGSAHLAQHEKLQQNSCHIVQIGNALRTQV